MAWVSLVSGTVGSVLPVINHCRERVALYNPGLDLWGRRWFGQHIMQLRKPSGRSMHPHMHK